MEEKLLLRLYNLATKEAQPVWEQLQNTQSRRVLMAMDFYHRLNNKIQSSITGTKYMSYIVMALLIKAIVKILYHIKAKIFILEV